MTYPPKTDWHQVNSITHRSQLQADQSGTIHHWAVYTWRTDIILYRGDMRILIDIRVKLIWHSPGGCGFNVSLFPKISDPYDVCSWLSCVFKYVEIKEFHIMIMKYIIRFEKCHLIMIFEIVLTHLGRMTHICVGDLIIIVSNNGLAPGRRQSITWTNAGLLSMWLIKTNSSEIWVGILSFSFYKMHLKISSAKMAAMFSRGRWVNSQRNC